MKVKHPRWKLLKALITGNAPVVHVSQWESDRIVADRHVVRETGLRTGMWVYTPEGVGIVTRLRGNGATDVMLTDESGNNRLAVRYAAGRLRQATHLEIPEARRPAPTRAQLMGYET